MSRSRCPQLLAYYRETVVIHADDPVLHACLICKQHRCPDWRFAWERLSCAGALLAEIQQPDNLPEDDQGEPMNPARRKTSQLAPADERTDDPCQP